MKKTISLICLIVCTFIWGTTFVAQDAGMDNIGPFTFNSVRFFVGFLAVVPFFLFFEKNKVKKQLKNKKNEFYKLIIPVGIFLFLGTVFQQVALIYTEVANAAFLTTLYVPIVAIISRFIFKSQLYWMIWVAVLLCVYGSYLLTSNQTLEIKKSDGLLFLSGVFFAFHIILIDIFMKKFFSPFSFALIQYSIVFILSFLVAIIFEDPSLKNIRLEWFEIIYCGIMSTGFAYTIQIIAQSKTNPAPAAIILSMESVFAAIAGWIIMDQYLDHYKLLGCLCILIGVILVQLIPIYQKTKKVFCLTKFK